MGAIALSLVITAELQFAIKDWSNLGLGYLYLLPVVVAGSWFGVRAATLVAAAATMIVTGWYASVPNTPTVAAEAVSLMIRATAYVGVGVVVGLHSQKLRGFAYADPLTGLPNRRAFFERCDQAIAARTPLRSPDRRRGQPQADQRLARTHGRRHRDQGDCRSLIGGAGHRRVRRTRRWRRVHGRDPVRQRRSNPGRTVDNPRCIGRSCALSLGRRHPRRRDCSRRPSPLPAEALPTPAECSIHGSRQRRSVGTRRG